MDIADGRRSSGLFPPSSIQCEHCNLEVDIPALAHLDVAHCPRCNHKLAHYHNQAAERLCALAFTSLILLICALPFDFIAFQSRGMEHSISIVQGMLSLYTKGYVVLALGVLITIIIIPAVILVSLSSLTFPLILQRTPKYSKQIIDLIHVVLPWSMAEIFLLSALVGMIKLNDMADVQFQPGFYLFSAFILSLLTTYMYIDRVQLSQMTRVALPPPRPINKAKSIQQTWALLITSILLYVPANMLPIMITVNFGNTKENSILSGVVTLWQSGSYPVAIVIFVASILVPILKILVLMWLLITIQCNLTMKERDRIRWYRLVEYIGRWSMVDIFVVAMLASLIQLGNAMTVIPGPAIVAFAGVVIMTIIAANTFDTRLIWTTSSSQLGRHKAPDINA